jgi:putative acyl-CoA dehydrogenase
MALDVLRILSKAPQALDAFLAEAELAAGADRRLDDHVSTVRRSLADGTDLEGRARRIAEDLALALQGSLVVRHAPPAVADAFCGSRLGEARGRTYGTLPADIDAGAIVDRHRPRMA